MLQHLLVLQQVFWGKAAEDHLCDRRMLRKAFLDSADRDVCSQMDWVAIYACADAGKSDRDHRPLLRQRDAPAIAVRKQCGFATFSALPHRPYGVDDVVGRKAIGLGHLGMPRFATAKQPAFMDQLWARSTVDRPIHPTAAQQR